MDYLLFPSSLAEKAAHVVRAGKGLGWEKLALMAGEQSYELLYRVGPAERVLDITERMGKRTLVGGNILEAQTTGCADLRAFLDNVRGQFVAFQQENATSVSVTTDIVNSSVPYCIQSRVGYVMSSRLDWCVLCADVPVTLNYSQMYAFTFGSMQVGNGTFFHEVSVVPPGQKATLEGPNCLSVGPWAVEPWAGANFSDGEPVEIRELADKLVEIARCWLEAYPLCSVGVTGGMDSRLTLAAFTVASRQLKTKLHTFTAGHRFSHDNRLSRRITRIAQTEHRQFLYNEETDIVPLMRELESEDKKLWLLCSGQGRHSYVYMYYMNQALRSEGFQCEVNSLGGEIIKGVYHRAVKTHNDPGRAVSKSLHLQQTVDEVLSLDMFSGMGRECLRKLREYFLQVGFAGKPNGLSQREQVDWFCWRNRFGRGRSPRYSFRHATGAIFYPLLERDFICLGARYPAEMKTDGELEKSITNLLMPGFARVPYLSGSYMEDFKVPLLWRAWGLVRRKILRNPIRQTGSFQYLRPHVINNWRDAVARISDCLPSFAAVADKLTSKEVLIGGSIDMRLYYVIRFLDDLIAGGLDLREGQARPCPGEDPL